MRRLCLVLLATIALAVLVTSVPVSRGAGIAPPEFVLTFTAPRSSLEEVRFGDQRVLMARGRRSILAPVVSGKRLNGLPRGSSARSPVSRRTTWTC